jgi:hypothetical protein
MGKTTVLAALTVLAAGRAYAQDNLGGEGPPAITAAPPTGPQANVNIELAVREEVESEEQNADVVLTESSEDPIVIEQPPAPEAMFLHGFRLGYLYIHDIDTALDSRNPEVSYRQRYDMRAPHLFMIGYEVVWRMIGYDWLNLLLIGNIMFAGFEQSRFFPSANLMIGFEIADTAQIGIGVSLTPTKEEPAHVALAAGWTPRIGSFYIPVHFFFVPDIEGHHKIGATVGVNFF